MNFFHFVFGIKIQGSKIKMKELQICIRKQEEVVDLIDKCMQVKPVIKLLKQTLVGTGALLVTAAFLFTFATPVEDFIQSSFSNKENTSNTSALKSNTKLNIRYSSKQRILI